MWRNTTPSCSSVWTGTALICTMLCLSLSSCLKSSDFGDPVSYDTTGLRNGDLLFRNGRSYESDIVTSVSSGKYSHIGIAYHAPSGWQAIHAVPGEAEKGQPEYLKCEPIAEFYRADRAQSGATARVKCTDLLANAAAEHALQIVKRHVVFDNDYDLNDSSQLYCTELVRLVYLSCGLDLSEGRRHTAPLIARNKVVFPEDIWVSRLLTRKKEF